VVPPLLLAALTLGEGPRILGAATEFLGAVRPRSRHAFTLNCHVVFGLCDLAGDLANPRRKLAPMYPRGGHPRQESFAVASFIASGHWGRVPIPSESTIEYGHVEELLGGGAMPSRVLSDLMLSAGRRG
jgi:hypothetical protein